MILADEVDLVIKPMWYKLLGCHLKAILIHKLFDYQATARFQVSQMHYFGDTEDLKPMEEGWFTHTFEKISNDLLGIMSATEVQYALEELHVKKYISLGYIEGDTRTWIKINSERISSSLKKEGILPFTMYHSEREIDFDSPTFVTNPTGGTTIKITDETKWDLLPQVGFKHGSKTCGIYKITNKQNSKVYVGQSRKIEERYKSHISGLKNGTHSNKSLLEDFKKYGGENFTFEIVKKCSEKCLTRYERSIANKLDVFNPEKGYNKQEIF